MAESLQYRNNRFPQVHVFYGDWEENNHHWTMEKKRKLLDAQKERKIHLLYVLYFTILIFRFNFIFYILNFLALIFIFKDGTCRC